MPRGRHRHSQPLHRLLPPATVIGVSAACAAGAWLIGDPVALRVLVAAATATAATGAILMRTWDRKAGRRVAELERARVRDEWRTEERIAELETDLEESRELRAALEGKLRAKRAELARLRNEHAGLLRRYATAETERASALEGRRLLAIGAAEPAPALPVVAGSLDGNGAPTPAAYLRAAEALRRLDRNAARQQARRTVEEARRRDAEQREADEPRGKHAAAAGHGGEDRTAAATRTPAVREHHTVPAAAAVVPYTPRRGSASRVQGGFDFFGTQSERAAKQRPELTSTAPDEDLADVVGAEVFAEHEAQQARSAERRPAQKERPAKHGKAVQAGQAAKAGQAGQGAASAAAAPESERPAAAPASGADGPGKVIDLTEHDETEQLDLRELRAHTS